MEDYNSMNGMNDPGGSAEQPPRTDFEVSAQGGAYEAAAHSGPAGEPSVNSGYEPAGPRPVQPNGYAAAAQNGPAYEPARPAQNGYEPTAQQPGQNGGFYSYTGDPASGANAYARQPGRNFDPYTGRPLNGGQNPYQQSGSRPAAGAGYGASASAANAGYSAGAGYNAGGGYNASASAAGAGYSAGAGYTGANSAAAGYGASASSAGAGYASAGQTGGQVPPRQNPVVKKKEKKGFTLGKAIALVLVCCLLSGACGFGGAWLAGKLSANKAKITQVASAPADTTALVEGSRHQAVDTLQVNTDSVLSPAQVYKANVNSAVGITTSVTTTNYWGYPTTAAASGSGFVLTADGYIVTNYHVIEGATSITVSMYSGTSYDAKIIGYDESNDVAVLKIEAEGLTPVVLGSSTDLSVGDSVLAIGNPLGELTFSLTTGIVSAKDRSVTLDSTVTMNLIQTDCAINSGNSGGPLFNEYGEVVGITNAKYSGSSSSGASIDNIGFAIPMDSVKPIITSIIEEGCIVKPYIGVSVGTVSTDARNYGLPAGASVASLSDDGPAKAAGLKENDIITEANGKPINSSAELITAVRALKPGDILHLTVYRSGKTLTIDVTVGEQRTSATANEDAAAARQQQQQQQQGGNNYGNGYGNYGNGYGYSFPFGDFFDGNSGSSRRGN